MFLGFKFIKKGKKKHLFHYCLIVSYNNLNTHFFNVFFKDKIMVKF